MATVLIETAPVEEPRHGSVELTFGIERFFTSEQQFEYMDNPIIHEVDRQRTIIRYV